MKWLQVCLLVAVVAATSAVELGYRRPRPAKLPRIFEDKLIEMLKKWIDEGIPELGVPKLDPLEVAELNAPRVSYHDVVIVEKCNLVNTKVDGLRNFAVNHVEIDPTDLTGADIEVDLTWSSLKAQGDSYDFYALVVGIFEIEGYGTFLAELTETRVRIRISIRTGDDGFLYVSAVELGPIDFKELNNSIVGLLGGGRVSDLINELIHLLANRIWDKASSAVAIMGEQLIRDIANEQLAQNKITMEQVIEWLMNGSH